MVLSSHPVRSPWVPLPWTDRKAGEAEGNVGWTSIDSREDIKGSIPHGWLWSPRRRWEAAISHYLSEFSATMTYVFTAFA